jgi:ADP-ribose pyrophosphatase
MKKDPVDEPVQVLSSETPYDGFLRLSRYRLRHRLYAGGWSRELVRERVERLRAVAVLPYDPVADRVVLIEQFRIGALEKGAGAWLLEIVGGMWDPDTAPETVARKEAEEEAGCAILDLLPVGDLWMSPGTASERVMLYCGRVDARGVGGIHGLMHEGEDIRVESMPFAAAMAAKAEGRLCSATAVIALQWLALNRERVRASWT